MPEVSSQIAGATSPYLLKPLWSVPGSAGVRGLSVVREGNYLVVWDENNCLQLLNAKGAMQARAKIPGQVVAAVAADSGSCYVAVTDDGGLFNLGPDLGVRRCRQFRPGVVALALDPHGAYLLFSDADCGLGMTDVDGVSAGSSEPLPRSLPGVHACLAVHGRLLQSGFDRLSQLRVCGLACGWSVTLAGWRSRAMAPCACLLQRGLQHYSFAGRTTLAVYEPCRLVSVAFASGLFLRRFEQSRLSGESIVIC